MIFHLFCLFRWKEILIPNRKSFYDMYWKSFLKQLENFEISNFDFEIFDFSNNKIFENRHFFENQTPTLRGCNFWIIYQNFAKPMPNENIDFRLSFDIKIAPKDVLFTSRNTIPQRWGIFLISAGNAHGCARSA